MHCTFCELALYFRVWGVNSGSPVDWNGSWRLMYIERPHLLFVGMELMCNIELGDDSSLNFTACLDLSFLLLIYTLHANNWKTVVNI